MFTDIPDVFFKYVNVRGRDSAFNNLFGCPDIARLAFNSSDDDNDGNVHAAVENVNIKSYWDALGNPLPVHADVALSDNFSGISIWYHPLMSLMFKTYDQIVEFFIGAKFEGDELVSIELTGDDPPVHAVTTGSNKKKMLGNEELSTNSRHRFKTFLAIVLNKENLVLTDIPLSEDHKASKIFEMFVHGSYILEEFFKRYDKSKKKRKAGRISNSQDYACRALADKIFIDLRQRLLFQNSEEQCRQIVQSMFDFDEETLLNVFPTTAAPSFCSDRMSFIYHCVASVADFMYNLHNRNKFLDKDGRTETSDMHNASFAALTSLGHPYVCNELRGIFNIKALIVDFWGNKYFSYYSPKLFFKIYFHDLLYTHSFAVYFFYYLFLYVVPDDDGVPAAKAQHNNLEAWLKTFRSPSMDVLVHRNHEQRQLGSSCGPVAIQVLKGLHDHATFENLFDNFAWYASCVELSHIQDANIKRGRTGRQKSQTSHMYDMTDLMAVYEDLITMYPREQEQEHQVAHHDKYIFAASFPDMLLEVASNIQSFQLGNDASKSLHICVNTHPHEVHEENMLVRDQPNAVHWYALTLLMERSSE
jgi:hypothetical protein